jgi:hypothetical protein
MPRQAPQLGGTSKQMKVGYVMQPLWFKLYSSMQSLHRLLCRSYFLGFGLITGELAALGTALRLPSCWTPP